MIPNPALHRTTLILRWTARLFGLLVFLFWGAFFLEHLSWFSHPSQLPSPTVFLINSLHFLMLTGLILAWKWEIPGASMVLIAAFVFFLYAAGRNFPLFFGVTAIPAILFITVSLLDRRRVVHIGPGQGEPLK